MFYCVVFWVVLFVHYDGLYFRHIISIVKPTLSTRHSFASFESCKIIETFTVFYFRNRIWNIAIHCRNDALIGHINATRKSNKINNYVLNSAITLFPHEVRHIAAPYCTFRSFHAYQCVRNLQLFIMKYAIHYSQVRKIGQKKSCKRKNHKR